jgi:hypothetical protein
VCPSILHSQISQSHEAHRSSSITEHNQVVGAVSVAARCSSPSSISSVTKVDQVMAERKIPNLYEYWKLLMVGEDDLSNFHAVGWLPDDLVCSPTTLEFPMIDHANIVCFESYLMCGLGLSPSKFLVAILNYLGCELTHLHPNAIAALSFFNMLCECCLDIPPNISLFWYFYSLTRYEQKLFYDLGLNLWCNR